MKFMRLSIIISVFAAVFLLQGSSPWEGAAATAPDGVLPVTGRYVATNSFPRNTVVDITNIETGKSTRAIVASGLDSPGLLAVVSREAAELIGMRSGSISRIRMIQPSDPIAYLRFTEGLASGIPEYDSGNVITDENLLEIYREDTYRPPAAPQEPEPPASVAGLRGPSYLLEPEWRGDRIIDLPGYDDAPPLTSAGQPAQSGEEIIKDVPQMISETPPREIVKDAPEYITGLFHEAVNKDAPQYITEPTREEVVKDVPEYIAETPREDVVKDTPAPAEAGQSSVEYVLVPADDCPPDSIYGINPSDIIPGITAAPSRPPAAVPGASFSVRTIPELELGKYYVQVAALPEAELAENTVRQIDRGYNPGIFRGSDNLYRVLIGPLNQGESAAVLQRFKSIGYRDAFVRRGGR